MPTPRLKNMVPPLIILAAAILPMLACLPNPWLWDDKEILSNRLSPENASSLVNLWQEPYWGYKSGPADTYRPLSLSLIYLERQLFGQRVIGYHLVSLLLHGVNCLLVYQVIDRLAGRSTGFATALLFAAHPVHVEAVAMVYGQLELLSFCFLMLAVWLYARSLDEDARPLDFVGSLLCILLATLCKESALMLPALLPLVRFCFPNNAPTGSGSPMPVSRLRRLGFDGLCLLATLPYLALRFNALGKLSPNAENTVSSGYSLAGRVHAVIVSVAHGLRLCSVPTGQTLYYGHLRDSVFGWPANEMLWLVIASAIAWMIVSDIGSKALLFGLGWFLIAFFPVSNVIPCGVLVAERTLYLPSLGICFIGGAFAAGSLKNRLLAPTPTKILFATLILTYSIGVFRFAGRLRDAETVWRSTVNFYPRSPLAHQLLGYAMLENHDKRVSEFSKSEIDEIDAHFQKALELNPTLTLSLVGQAQVAEMQGDWLRLESLCDALRQATPTDEAELAIIQSLLAKRRVRPMPDSADTPK